MSTPVFQPDFKRDNSYQPDLHPTAIPYDRDRAYQYIKESGFALIQQAIEPAVLENLVSKKNNPPLSIYSLSIEPESCPSNNTAYYYGYSTLATYQRGSVIAEAKRRYAIEDVAAIHRVGFLEAGDIRLWVGVSAESKEVATAAGQWIIDTLEKQLCYWRHDFDKHDVPEWLQVNRSN
ncbi:molybdenum cofactor biosynthesis protein MoaE [Psychrobacter sanguinis]|uniref:molybdenum cofactor biosynthesis protein MoaE n=1 Tax=Psychrobacter sanguinis TaxID=861445 RepID=UPI002A74FD09|nr:molybdenum cofactor biosynthesis protein MoaE [Psychrobacter sanguinis]MDY3306962.1 molybdenum cofactor biosynthesis protein MoaE [Psychrobacter sanguinis]